MTETTEDRDQVLFALQRTLEACGADETRWLDADRARFAALIGKDIRAQKLISEAAALDQLLDSGDLACAESHDALVARVVAAAAREASAVQGRMPENVHLLSSDKLRIRRANLAKVGLPRRDWGPMALLAASLLMGVFVGLSGRADDVLSLFLGAAQAAPLHDETALVLGDELDHVSGSGPW